MSTKNAIPAGLCQCGCGGKTAVATQSHRRHGWRKGEPLKYIRGHSFRGRKHSEEARRRMGDAARGRVGPSAPNWRGGRRVHHSGYVELTIAPDHPLIKMASKYNATSYRIFEHRLVAAQALGRALTPTEQVHHIDESRDRNSPANLLVVSGSTAHREIHRLQRTLEAEWDSIKKLLQLDRRRKYRGPVMRVGAAPMPKVVKA